MRSGAPSTASEATEPANMPNSKPRSAAMRAETASCTEAGCTHALPARIARNRERRELQRDGIVILPDGGDPSGPNDAAYARLVVVNSRTLRPFAFKASKLCRL